MNFLDAYQRCGIPETPSGFGKVACPPPAACSRIGVFQTLALLSFVAETQAD